MPGSGKTTLGRQLAAHYGCPFLDLDEAIVARAGREIPAIFQTQGEAYFRQLEADTLREVLARPGPLVLATGGGTPCFHENMSRLAAAGRTVWLDVPLPLLAARLRAAGLASRPLLAAATAGPGENAPAASAANPLETWLYETLAARRRFYSKAELRLTDTALAPALALLGEAGLKPAKSASANKP